EELRRTGKERGGDYQNKIIRWTTLEEQQREEQLEEVSRKLILREEQLFSQDSPCELEVDQLQKDFEAFRLQIWMAVHNTFTTSSSSSSSSSTVQLEVLRSAVASIQQQEVQDRRWTGSLEERMPEWRPQNRQVHLVCCMGRRVKEDLLTVVRTVKDCYPPQVDIMNLYAGLYHQNFSSRLTELAAAGLEADDCGYLLFWTNHCYPHDILNHEELQGNIKTLWLNTALMRDEQSWTSSTPELIDHYCFSPLAVDVIQFSCVIRDQSKAQRITAHLEIFLSSYKKSVEEFVKGNHCNVRSVIKAQLVCELQFRYNSTLCTPVHTQRRCVDTLSALKDCGYRCLTAPIHTQLKVCFTHLWTSVWLDGSLPVVDSLLDSLNQQLMDLTDLKPDCRQALLSLLHQDVVLKYVKRMMKSRMKSREQQVGGAQRMIEDARKINDFFNEGGCSESLWLGELLCSLAEIVRLQDPGSVQLEMVTDESRFIHHTHTLTEPSDWTSTDDVIPIHIQITLV
uniref:Tumor necrosis factor, alpha-induced protein 2b n=1 Tax=Sparus aurata TaxID=8175 RepID=A0A671U009_SPAAU